MLVNRREFLALSALVPAGYYLLHHKHLRKSLAATSEKRQDGWLVAWDIGGWDIAPAPEKHKTFIPMVVTDDIQQGQ